MTTTKRPTTSTPRKQIKSSAATTDVSLSVAGDTSSGTPKTSKPRNVYPCLRACKVCGKDFTLHGYREGAKTTCSPECARAAISKARTGQTMLLEARKGRTITCPVCGTEIWKPNAWLRKAKTAYCSASCRSKAEHGPRMPRYAANGKGKKNPKKGRKGAANHAWKGGVMTLRTHGNYAGVRFVRCPPEFLGMARKDGYIVEHRLVVAQAIGRLLSPVEVVHHIDHNPLNNVLSNLMLFANNREHKMYEARGLPLPLWP